MNRFSSLIWMVILGTLWVGGSGVRVYADAGKTFDELYGKQMRKVKVTRGVEDDVELAEAIWKAAETIKESKVLRAVMLEAVHELTARTDAGVTRGVGALEELGRINPKKANVYQKQLVGIWERVYRRAKGESRKRAGRELVKMMIGQGKQLVRTMRVREASAVFRKSVGIAQGVRLSNVKYLKALMNHATSLIGVVREIKKLEEAGKGGSLDEEGAKRLGRLYVVKFDAPEQAKGVLTKVGETEKALIEGAMLALENASVEQCSKLWAWYYKLSEGERGLVLLNMLNRAEGYLKRYLEESKEKLKGTDELRLKLTLTRIETKLDALREKLGDVPRWKDLTKYFAKMVAEEKYGKRDTGKVTFKNGVFSCGGYATWMIYPAQAKDVIISAEIKRIDGQVVRMGGRVRSNEVGGRYEMELRLSDVVAFKWGKREEIMSKTVKGTGNGKSFELQFALLGDQLVVALNGKKVMQMKDARNMKPGDIFFGTGNARAELQKLRVMLPSKEQAKRYLAGLK